MNKLSAINPRVLSYTLIQYIYKFDWWLLFINPICSQIRPDSINSEQIERPLSPGPARPARLPHAPHSPTQLIARDMNRNELLGVHYRPDPPRWSRLDKDA